MTRHFIELEELNSISKKEMGERNAFKYNRIKEIASKTQLKLGQFDLNVGEEVFFVTTHYGETPHVVSALCKGYTLTTAFSNYNENTGIVDFHKNTIFIDKEGNEYSLEDGTINSIICDTKEEAEECLFEILSDLEE